MRRTRPTPRSNLGTIASPPARATVAGVLADNGRAGSSVPTLTRLASAPHLSDTALARTAFRIARRRGRTEGAKDADDPEGNAEHRQRRGAARAAARGKGADRT